MRKELRERIEKLYEEKRWQKVLAQPQRVAAEEDRRESWQKNVVTKVIEPGLLRRRRA